jgi:hypothetical protein
VLGQLEHVVGVAGLGRVRAQVPGHLALREEVLVLAVAAYGVGVVVRDQVPEVLGYRPALRLPGDLVGPRRPDDLRDLAVCVEPGQYVAVLEQRVHDRPVVEAPGHRQVARVSSQAVDLGEDVHHPPLLDLEHGLELGRPQPLGHRVHPVGEPERHRAGLLAAAQDPGVLEAVQHLVLGVPGHPGPGLEGERPGNGLDLAVPEAAQGRQLDRRQGPDVTVAVGLLALGHLGDDVVDPRLEPRVPGGGVLLRYRRQVVAERVAGDPRRLPAAVDLALRRVPGVQPRVVEQPVGLDGEEVVRVALHGRLERAVEEADVAQGEGPGGWGHRRDWRGGPCERQG